MKSVQLTVLENWRFEECPLERTFLMVETVQLDGGGAVDSMERGLVQETGPRCLIGTCSRETLINILRNITTSALTVYSRLSRAVRPHALSYTLLKFVNS